MSDAQTVRPAITTYGERNPNAPPQLDVFSFLVGKWEGKRTIKLADETSAEVTWSWIGRYVLDGMAIADEIHASVSDGSQYWGVTLRQYDASKKSWIVEFINVTMSFLRRQVNATAGSVSVDGKSVTVISEAPDMWSRETYRVESRDYFVYTLELSKDAGRSWAPPQIEMPLSRKE